MRTLLSFVSAAVAAISLPARADSFHVCGESYHWDSYQRGIEAAFRGNADLRPSLNDEGCYQAGLSEGSQARSAGDPRCDDNFSAGHAEGIDDALDQSGGSCRALGYDAGRADLDIGARKANARVVGSACVQAYRTGHADYLAGNSGDSSRFDDPRALYCYNLGLYEGPLLLR